MRREQKFNQYKHLWCSPLMTKIKSVLAVSLFCSVTSFYFNWFFLVFQLMAKEGK